MIAGCSAQVRVGPDFGTAVGVAVLAAGMYKYEMQRTGEPVPELAPSRVIVEHDCTRPIDGIYGNLKCR